MLNSHTVVLSPPPHLSAVGEEPEGMGSCQPLLHHRLVGVRQHAQALEGMGSVYGGLGEGVVGVSLVRTPLEIESGKHPSSVYTGILSTGDMPVPGCTSHQGHAASPTSKLNAISGCPWDEQCSEIFVE